MQSNDHWLLTKMVGNRPSPQGWECKCPAHEDNRESLSVTLADDGKVLLHCHAGCTPEAVCQSWGITLAELTPAKDRPTPLPSRIVATYDYHDASGKLVYQVVRKAPKQFMQRRPDPHAAGQWLYSIKGITPVPYRLPAILKAAPDSPIIIVEGEKDVDNLVALGYQATCNSGGAGKWKSSFANHFTGRTVIIIPDNDTPGNKHADAVFRNLEKSATDVRILPVPAPHKDVSQYIDAGGDIAILIAGQTRDADDARSALNPARNTDMGNAERLLELAGPDLRHSPGRGWLTWTGSIWRQGDAAARELYKHRVIPAIYTEAETAAQDRDSNLLKLLSGWARSSESTSKMNGCLDMASSDAQVAITDTDIDSNPDILPCPNGTVELTSGLIRQNQRSDLSTRMSPVRYDPLAKCPRWLTFLEETFPDAGVREWIHRCIGYTLTGHISEQVMFILYGTGKNGKSVFCNILAHILGDYAMESSPDVLMTAKPGGSGSTNDLARLVGARLVGCNETQEGQRLAEGLVKQITGGDRITARYLYKETFEYTPQFKVWLRTNHKPVIRGTDEGIWRRIRLIPCTNVVSEANMDKNLEATLRAEAPGILAWAVRGTKLWRTKGLSAPAAVTQAISGYRGEMDIIRQWLETCCVTGAQVAYQTTSAKELYKSYADWCEENGERKFSQRRLAMVLRERGIESRRLTKGMVWDKIALRSDEDEPQEEY